VVGELRAVTVGGGLSEFQSAGECSDPVLGGVAEVAELLGVVGAELVAVSAGVVTQRGEVLVMLAAGVVEFASQPGEGGAVLSGGALSRGLLRFSADVGGVGLGCFLVSALDLAGGLVAGGLYLGGGVSADPLGLRRAVLLVLGDDPALVVVGRLDPVRGVGFRGGDFLLGGPVDALGLRAGRPLTGPRSLSSVLELRQLVLGVRGEAFDLGRGVRPGALDLGESLLSGDIGLGAFPFGGLGALFGLAAVALSGELEALGLSDLGEGTVNLLKLSGSTGMVGIGGRSV
jgi:hypothetical protein